MAEPVTDPEELNEALLTEPDHNLGFLKNVSFHQDAEDVVTLRLRSRDDTTVDVKVTDRSVITLMTAVGGACDRMLSMMNLQDLINADDNTGE